MKRGASGNIFFGSGIIVAASSSLPEVATARQLTARQVDGSGILEASLYVSRFQPTDTIVEVVTSHGIAARFAIIVKDHATITLRLSEALPGTLAEYAPSHLNGVVAAHKTVNQAHVLNFRKHKQLFFRLSLTALAMAPQPAAFPHSLLP